MAWPSFNGEIMKLLYAILLALVLLGACAKVDGQTTTPGNETAGVMPCPAGSKDVEICTEQYAPVCANGKTYGNSCFACQQADSYVKGECATTSLFEVRYAGGFVMVEQAQTVFTATESTFKMETLTNDNQVTSTKTKELTQEELAELQQIIAGIGTLKQNYTLEGMLVADAGYAEINVKGQTTRVDPNIEDSYPAELLALRQWIDRQAMMLPDAQGRTYQTRDAEVCMRIKYACDEGMRPFSDESGCGCEADTINVNYVQCEDPRPEACTREYMPVCANVDTGIRCIRAPCPSAEQKTYSNKCEACADPKVNGYVPGAC
jgi:hypothetical protein